MRRLFLIVRSLLYPYPGIKMLSATALKTYTEPHPAVNNISFAGKQIEKI
jgi:hypothetical protein